MQREFDTNLFLKFLFSVIFLFVCCFCLMLYVDRALALVVAFLLRFLVLPKNIRFHFTGLHIAPLQARVFFRGLSLQTENLSLRIVDGYITFAFWGFWFRHPRWSRLHEYMVGDSLIGTRCRVRRNLHYVKGTIVAVDEERKKVSVQLDEHHSDGSSLDEDEGGDEDDDIALGAGSRPASPVDPFAGGTTGAPTALHHRIPSTLHNSVDTASMPSTGAASVSTAPPATGSRRTRVREFSSSPIVLPLREAHARPEPHVRPEGLGDEVVKAVDVADVYVRSRAGILQLHLNGVRLCLYNATGKYLDLARAAAAANEAANESNVRKDRKASTNAGGGNAGSGDAERRTSTGSTGSVEAQAKQGLAGVLRAISSYALSHGAADLDANGRDDGHESSELRAARKLQEHNMLTTTFMQKFFNFIGCVELEVCAAQIDIGGAAAAHPYFLHLTFQQGEGRVFLTKDSCPAIDLYRSVVELTLREVDIRMAQIDSKLSKTQVMRKATLLERARLLVSGVAAPYDHVPLEASASSELVDEFGIFMNGKDKGTVHLVCYKDAPNVYAGEAVRRGALPTTGVEVLIDAPVVRYGPWLEYCRTQLWQYFLPPNYLHLQELLFDVGKPRPNAGFELLVMFLRATTVEVPFKRRSIVPSPPFGILDSKRKGTLVATIGEGAQYIQPAFFLLPNEEKQEYQGLFIAKDVTVWANCVLERETILCHAESVQFFLDRQDARVWNGRKLWNILTKLSGVELYWYMVYVDFFLDLINDWQFSACMYHGMPLTTELFNTVNRAVRDCIPNVKRFEIFVEAGAVIHLNVNSHNVVYADDPNDLSHNVMAILKVQSGRFSMVLPSDQYQLSFENEVARPMEAVAHEVRAYLSLPTSHPLYEEVSSEVPWAYSEVFHMHGLFTMLVPNQSIPLPRDNLDTSTGRTRYHNFFNLDLEFMNLRGTLMGTHIKALIDCFQNIFLDNTFTIAPDELFWLLAKLQSHATTGRNKRKEFKQFLEQSQPAGNDMEICVTVRFVDLSATATTSQAPGAPQVNLSTGLLTFTYVKQFAVTDTAVTLTPLTVRFPDRRGNFARNPESSIVVGAITVGLTKHFGRMPLKPKVHEAMEVHVDGVSIEVTAEQLMVVVEVAQTIARHFATEDMMMEAEVAEALSTAELSAEKVVRAGPLRNTTDRRRRDGLRQRHQRVPQSRVPVAYRTPEAPLRTRGSGGPSAFRDSADRDGASDVRFYDDDDDRDGSGQRGAGADDDNEVDDDDDEYSDGAVEMRQWRSAQRAARMEARRRPLRSGSDSDDNTAHNWAEVNGSDVIVDVRDRSRDKPMGGSATRVPILHGYESDSGHNRKRRRRFFGTSDPRASQGSSGDDGHQRWRPFASQVPYDVALGFAKFMEDCNKADDDSRDYGLFFLMVQVGTVNGAVRIGEDGYAALELPLGASMAHSTVNDGNSNKRMSVAVKDAAVQLLMSRGSDAAQRYLPSLRTDSATGKYLEVLSLRSSVCLRQYVAYPFDNSLADHRQHQQRFVEENDYEGLIGFPFDKTTAQCPTTPEHPPASPPPNVGLGVGAAAFPQPPQPTTARGGEATSPTAAPSSAVAVEPATLPRPSAAVHGPAALTSPSQRGAPPLASSDAHAGVPNMLPLPLIRAVGSGAGTKPRAATSAPATRSGTVAQAADHDADVVSRTSTPNSNSTRAHAQRAGEAEGRPPLQSMFPSFSTSLQPDEKERMESSNRFVTCASVTSSSSSSRGSSHMGSAGTDSFLNTSSSDSAVGRLLNRAFAGDRDTTSSLGEEPSDARGSTAPSKPGTAKGPATPGGGGGKGGSPPPRADAGPAAAGAHLFYRSFDKAECDDNGPCAVDYWPPQRPRSTQKIRDRTRFHAQLPIVGFYVNTDGECHAPQFFSYVRRQLLQREENLFAWARCVADNRERSQNNSTSRHLHVAFLDPVTLLVTPEAAVLVASAVRLVMRVRHSLSGPRVGLSRESTSANLSMGASPTTPTPQPRMRLRPRSKKSKARTQQKRWLWESNIVSAALPIIEVKLLTRLPVPAENLPSATAVTDGVYTSTLLVRGLRLLMAENRPPTGEEVAAEVSQRMSASVRLDTLALVSQIEWEPMPRVGNLAAKVPDLWYSPDKPTMAIAFVTEVAGKVKRDLWRGADGGASNITAAQVAVHMTRDFADYVQHLLCLIDEVTTDVRRRLQSAQRHGAGVAGDPHRQCPASPVQGAPDLRSHASAGPLQEIPQLRKGRVVQGKGFIGHVTLTLIDAVRQGERIVLNQSDVSRLDIHRPFCNFVVVTRNLMRDRNVHVQGVGEMESVQTHAFPSVVHVLHPRVVKRGLGTVALTVQSPKARSGRTPSFQQPLQPTPSTTVGGLLMQSSVDMCVTADTPATAPAQADVEQRPLVFIYDGTFTVRRLDVRVQQADTNYLQLVGTDLTGCAESRAEAVASRECVLTEALTQTISETLKARLRYKANRARERAKRSRYPAPPQTTEQLHLRTSASFFAQQMQVNYIADCVLESILRDTAAPLPSSSPHLRTNRVFSAVISGVGLVAQFAQQHITKGDQVNLQMMVRSSEFESPYCLRTAETLHPQVHLLIASWRRAVCALQRSMGHGSAADRLGVPINLRRGSSGGVSRAAAPQSSAVTIQVQATSITGFVGLPQGIVQKFLLPQISCFTTTSSSGHANLKAHLHPFTITSHNTPRETYRVVLPHVYLLYAHDPIKMLCNVSVGTVAFTITPLFINHSLLTYEKLMNDVAAIMGTPQMGDDDTVSPAAPGRAATDEPLRRKTSGYASSAHSTGRGHRPASGGSLSPTEANPLSDAESLGKGTGSRRDRRRRGTQPPGDLDHHAQLGAAERDGRDRAAAQPAPPASPQHHRRRQSFLFLLQGVRLSYLTSMTTLRFTIRALNATADTTEGDARHTLRWVVHVANAQAALVDRDDHDQMVATFNTLSQTNRAAASPAGTATAGGREAPTSGTSNYAGARASASSRAGTDTATAMKVAHPLSGFLWGSVAVSFTLSSGKIDENRAKAALAESTSLLSYSEELQKALLDSLTHSTSTWELAIYEPLVVVRIGLDHLVKQCIRETEEDVRVMKEAAYEADFSASLRLRQHKRFQHLQEQKKRLDGLIRKAERERRAKLRSMTERVVSDVAQRRGGIALDADDTSTLSDFFNIRRSHKIVASVTNFMVVLPFGDAAYRSVLEELPDTFACGKTDRHIHSALCLNRRRFIPSFALKVKMNDVSFICNLEVVKHMVPVLVADARQQQRNDSMFANAGAAEQGCTTSLLFYGRLLALHSHVYFTDGVPLDASTELLDLLRDMPVLGGQGVLSCYSSEEHQRSLNRISVSSVEAPLRIEKRNHTMHVGVVVDVSEPKAQVSSRALSIVRELTQEQAITPLLAHVRPRRRRPRPQSERPAGSATADAGGGDGGGSQASPQSAQAEAPLPPKEPLSLHLDITGRLEASELAVFCYTNPEKWRAQPVLGAGVGVGARGSAGGGGVGTGGRAGHARSAYANPRSLRTASSVPAPRRRVVFETPASQNNRMRAARNAQAAAGANGGNGAGGAADGKEGGGRGGGAGDGVIDFNTNDRFLIMSIPLPGITLRTVVRQGRRETSEDTAVVLIEVRAGAVELSPSITALAQEVEMCAASHQASRTERTKKILSLVQALEQTVPQLCVPLHCPLVEVLLPMPRAFQAALSKARMDDVVRLRRDIPSMRSCSGASAEAALVLDRTAAIKKPKSRGLLAVHLNVSDFRLIFNSEPVSSTLFTVYLDRGGSINLVLKLFRRSDGNERFLNKFPDSSIVVTMRRVRAECQTRLEVKSLEVSLPEAELTVSRRSGALGLVDTLAVFFPFNVEGNEPNLTMRLQHVSQLFLVVDLWSITTSETLKTVRQLFRRGATGSLIAKSVAGAQLARQMAKGPMLLPAKQRGAQEHRTLLYGGLARAVCFFDLGAGSTHSFTIAAANAVAESAKHGSGYSINLFMGRISNISIRSEGVLSGGVHVGGVMAKAFVIQNADGTGVFARSPEQRTFREALLVQQLHVNFKERQLKDVFECKVGSFSGNSMDGIGEEEFTTTDLDVSLYRGTLGVTPSTVPAGLSFLRNISSIVAEQRRIAAMRMQEKMLAIQTFHSVAGRVNAVVKELQQPVWMMSDASTPNRSHSTSESSVSTQVARARIPFMGNSLLRVPCGQLRVSLEETSVLLGAIASGEAAAGCVVLSFPKARLSFAECPCDDYRAAKKVLVVETRNFEVFRPGNPRVVVMGFQGVNHFEFYTRQVLGSPEVGFTLTLQQTHPWTGNPRFRDFEEMISLVKSFTDKKNADVFQKFGRVDTVNFDSGTQSPATRRDSGGSVTAVPSLANAQLRGSPSLTIEASVSAMDATEASAGGEGGAPAAVVADTRTLKALRSSKFSPQLRFGGDVSVNTEVILNWLGVTEKMLPHVVHVKLCDALEKLLYRLAELASERVTDAERSERPSVGDGASAEPAATGRPRASADSPPPFTPHTPEARQLRY